MVEKTLAPQRDTFRLVGVDSLYGSNARFLNALEDLGEKFMGDVGKTTKIWTSDPQLETSKKQKEGAGRPRARARLHKENDAKYISVEDLVGRDFEASCRSLKYRQGQKGKETVTRG